MTSSDVINCFTHQFSGILVFHHFEIRMMSYKIFYDLNLDSKNNPLNQI